MKKGSRRYTYRASCPRFEGRVFIAKTSATKTEFHAQQPGEARAGEFPGPVAVVEFQILSSQRLVYLEDGQARLTRSERRANALRQPT